MYRNDNLIQRVNHGEPISASKTINPLIDAANRGAIQFDGRDFETGNYGGVTYVRMRPAGSTSIAFRNDSGEQVPAYAIMRVTGAFSTSSDSPDQVVTISKPAHYGAHGFYLVNDGNTVDNGKQGTAQFPDGPIVIAYDTAAGAPLVCDIVGPVPGSWLLNRYVPGFICWRTGFTISGLSGNYLFCQYQPMTKAIGKPLAAITANTTGTIEFWKGPKGAETATGFTTNALVRYGDVDTTTMVDMWTFGNGDWYVDAANCVTLSDSSSSSDSGSTSDSGSGSGSTSGSGSDSSTGACSECPSAPTSFNVTIPSLTNGGCSDCGTIADTYTLQHAPDGLDCIWTVLGGDGTIISLCGGDFQLNLQYAGGLTTLTITENSGPSDVATYNASGCPSSGMVLSLFSHETACSGWPATLTIT